MTREEALTAIRGFMGQLTDGCQEALFCAIPELRESEDERIRKWLIKTIHLIGVDKDICADQETMDKAIAWLEKQKINTEGDFGRGYDCGYQAGYAVAMNEMKPKVATATLDSEKQKEPKPELVQYPPITYTYPSDASRDARLKAALLALLNSDLLKVKEGGYFTKQDLIEWVARIPTDKPAWSEEDEKMVANLRSTLANISVRGLIKKETEQKYSSWLKSLRPSWKPSDQDELMKLKYAGTSTKLD